MKLFWNLDTPQAMKVYVCKECEKEISVGEYHVYRVLKSNKGFRFSFRYHLDCSVEEFKRSLLNNINNRGSSGRPKIESVGGNRKSLNNLLHKHVNSYNRTRDVKYFGYIARTLERYRDTEGKIELSRELSDGKLREVFEVAASGDEVLRSAGNRSRGEFYEEFISKFKHRV